MELAHQLSAPNGPYAKSQVARALGLARGTWLTHPLLDPQKSGRVIMDNLMKLVTTALELSYAQAEKNVSPKHLEVAAESLTLRRDAIHLIDDVEGNQEDSEPNPK